MKEIVILADGEFPNHPVPVSKLKNSTCIICCDGAASKLDKFGMEPYAIVGDLDSLPTRLKEKFQELLHQDNCQETNDLTKAFNFAKKLDPSSITILGATGMREDHTLGNISLLTEYAHESCVPVEMYTNHGLFSVITKSGVFRSSKGAQISFFTTDTNTRISSKGLKYPLDHVVFDNWWKASLNECTSNEYSLEIRSGNPIIVFTTYK
jgi:thiamine pyrophosphokinase